MMINNNCFCTFSVLPTELTSLTPWYLLKLSRQPQFQELMLMENMIEDLQLPYFSLN